MKIRQERLNAFIKPFIPSGMMSETFKVVVAVPEGSQSVIVPTKINSLQLAIKSRKNQRKSAASLSQFVRILACTVINTHTPTPIKTYGRDRVLQLEEEIVKRMAGEFYPKIVEYENALSEQERGLMLTSERGDIRVSGLLDIKESELESYLTSSPKIGNEKAAIREDAKVKHPELDALDGLSADELATNEPKGAPSAEVYDDEVYDDDISDAGNEKEPKKEDNFEKEKNTEACSPQERKG
ncbi:hypothetical protein GNI_181040 [Gregarina niphandrodes]|uniref:Uncharacterized protein n=1 Tax=Gregarina niphandrodes TaxID=110365 RepID=A0A023AXB0_GRENI|nr:hypothetical protein GNI_181040 [Gregarina niphandrodes]EZG43232.1 hypothetical protein GNI_181040 [Gregarina niphandrodes]|eukprot:XP_011133510.1 hypothetical protein GNI_181040 [Gregarina niphandrodes]